LLSIVIGEALAYPHTARAGAAQGASITVQRPNGGESWSVGMTHTIRWTTTGSTAVDLLYQTSPEFGWLTIAQNVPASSGRYEWTVPNTVTSAARVRVVDTLNSGVADTSDMPFTITSILKIMPLGDSITDGEGVIGGGGYRIELRQRAVAQGLSIDFVGSLMNGPATLPDKEHEGHSGWEISRLAQNVNPWLTAYKPELVLLLIGTNDVFWDMSMATAPARLSALIDQILTTLPDASVIVSTIPPLADAARESRGLTFNAAIEPLVQNKQAAGLHVSFVDIHAALTTADLADGTHPNQTGYDKMAAVWFAGLLGVLPSENRPPSVSLTAPLDGAVLQAPATVAVRANASDADGEVRQVVFYDGTTLIGTDSSAPFEATLTNPVIGGHTLQAHATDDDGALTASAAIQITIESLPPVVEPAPPPRADVTPAGTPIALITAPTGAGSKSLNVIRDGVFPPVGSRDSTKQYDTFAGYSGTRTFDWIGYQFAGPMSFVGLTFQEGRDYGDGGWFDTLGVQVRNASVWTDVSAVTVTPTYPRGNGLSYETFELSFPSTMGDAIRIGGRPGGWARYISVGELRVWTGEGVVLPRAVTVKSPNGGETWSVGMTHSIRWQATTTTAVDLFYQASSSGDWISIAQRVPAASGRIDWKVPNVMTPDARIRVVDSDSVNVADGSDLPFVISSTTKVMPLGDSITDGVGVENGGGYRTELWRLITAQALSIDFVGSMMNGPAALPDKNHEGHSGWEIALLAQNANPWLTSFRPELVLLMIGTNDIARSTDPPGAPARLSALVDQIIATLPGSHVVVAAITPLADPTQDQRAVTYNTAIDTLIRQKQTAGMAVSFVDMHAALTTADLADGAHPNASGYTKMAWVWFTELMRLRGTIVTGPPPTGPPPNQPPPGSGSTRTDITTSGTPVALITAPTGGGSKTLAVINDGVRPPVGSRDITKQYDTFTGYGGARTFDWIGYQFTAPQNFVGLTFQEGRDFGDGGWFDTLRVQVRNAGVWTDVTPLGVAPTYPRGNALGFETFELTFPATVGDAIRVAGVPGGWARYISVAELRVWVK
jgi:lysophospholipase L1-like esterase